MAPQLVNPQFFTHNPFRKVYTCNICPAPQPAQPLSLAARHEDTRAHTHSVRMRDHAEDFVSAEIHAGASISQHATASEVYTGASIEAPNSQFSAPPTSLASLAVEDPWLQAHDVPYPGIPTHPGTPQATESGAQQAAPAIHGPALPDDPVGQIYDNWHGLQQYNRPEPAENQNEPEMPCESESKDVSLAEEWTQAEQAELEAEGPHLNVLDSLTGEAVRDAIDEGPHYVKMHLGAQDYWPWNDRPHCTLDILGGFPRSMYSESELEATRWFGHMNGMATLPSVKAVKRRRDQIVEVAGSKPKVLKSSKQNMYTMTSLATILEHEYANPLVMSRLETLPEKSGELLEEASQADRWGDEVDPNLACPMVRGPDGKSFFVNELALIAADAGGRVVPVMVRRWFRHGGALWGRVNPILIGEDQLVIDARKGNEMVLPLLSFRHTVEDLLVPETCRELRLPSPEHVAGMLVDEDGPLKPWDEPVCNYWRGVAKGMRVDGCPLWLYCDDTSGNTSKKWNKHNSLLFTLAGLPHSLVHLMYNIHYLATSNIAPPLEMMEELVEQLCEARRTGVVVWDCVAKELVLVIPWILAFLGDNPMSSEFASHIGMQGKCFCRKCKVRGADTKNRPAGEAGEKERLEDFLNDGHQDRTKAQTIQDLEDQLVRALGGAPSGVDDMATESGTKDKFFMSYVAQLQEAVNEAREQQKTSVPPTGMSKHDEAKMLLEKVRMTMPANLFSPVLRIPELDANQDTPFEALHVVLLGAVKYFWRDAVSRQNADGKEVLITRLNSLDPRGLGLSLLRGETLVHYAGSLVGRDFRAVLQVAPAVLYDLIPAEAYEAWLALGRLAPLIFQPVIRDRTSYMERLMDAVQDFLGATALWTTQWFNKPKFHLFLHLPFYVRRFGPAILYATEGFESYNFLIRLRSVHSNRHAPSTDIGEAFSFLHAVRHLVSGGYVNVEDKQSKQDCRRQGGDGVRDLVRDKIFRHLMGMDGMLTVEDVARLPLLPKDPQVSFNVTQTAQRGFLGIGNISSDVLRCVGLYLANGDVAREDGWVIYREPAEGTLHGDSKILCARVQEILIRADDGGPLGVLLQRSTISPTVEKPYRLPRVRLQENSYTFISATDILGTVHVFHNCAKHACLTAHTRIKTQERVVLDNRVKEIQHSDPTDLLLNLAQLSNAQLLTPFRVALSADRYPPLSRHELVEHAMDNRARLAAAVVEKKQEQEQRKAAAVEKKQEKAQKRQEKAQRKAEKQREREQRKAAAAEKKQAQERRKAQHSANDIANAPQPRAPDVYPMGTVGEQVTEGVEPAAGSSQDASDIGRPRKRQRRSMIQ